MFDALALKREFPSLADTSLHYLDSAATAQMPDVVLSTLRRFELEARANVHEVVHKRARAATEAYQEARARVNRFHLWRDIVDQFAGLCLGRVA
jgi:cysteine desulfurase/selenocysteine lyase